MKVWTPIRIGPLEIANRLINAPTVKNIATPQGYVTKRMVEIYKEIAKGGVGLIVVEATFVHPRGKTFRRMLGISSTSHIPGHADLVDEVKLTNPRVKIVLQLMHGGRQAGPNVIGVAPLAPSEKHPWVVKPQVLTTKECDEIVTYFADAAARAKEAGYDGVLLHGAHGFLMWQFMSHYVNDRTDEYGDRLYFVRRVIEEIKNRVGKDYPISIRINGDDYLGEESITIDWTTKVLAPALERAGIVHIDVSAAPFETLDWQIQPMYYSRACILHLAEAVKKAVKIPVSSVGRIGDPGLIEKIIEEGRVDMVSLCRPILADPYLPKKMMEGRLEDIRMCTSCSDGCTWRLFDNKDCRCAINPEFGFPEMRLGLWPLVKRKKVFVAGGGPGGMEAARVLALRGHDVTLYEKTDELGGRLLLASAPPLTREWETFVKWLTTQLKKLDVNLELGKEVTPELIEKMKLDAIILATGSLPYIPKEIPGYDKPLVVTEDDAIRMGPEKLGERIVILGGKAWGCEIAAWFGEEEKKVTIIEEQEKIATEIEPIRGVWCLPKMLKEGGVKTITEAKVEEIKDNGVVITDKTGKKQFIEADNIVLSLDRIPNNELEKKLRAKLPKLELYAIGDCVEPRGIRRIMNAVHQGARIAREV